MSTEKTLRAKDTSPERMITKFRDAIGLSRQELAAKLGVNRVAVLYWENGRSAPSTENYIRLANLAKNSTAAEHALWFWEQAGVDLNALKELIPEVKKAFKEHEKRVKAADVVPIPLLRGVTYVNSPSVAPAEEVEARLPLPTAFIPNPAATSCLAVPHDYLRSTLGKGDVLIVDGSEQNPDNLWGAMVVAYHTPLKEPRDHELGPRAGIHVGWLRRRDLGDHGYLAELDISLLNSVPRGLVTTGEKVHGLEKLDYSDSPVVIATYFGFRTITPDMGWRVLGRVIGWLRAASKQAPE